MSECEKCIHRRICDIWSKQECQSALCFVDDCFEPEVDPETLPIVQELRGELAEEHEQLRCAKKCIAGLSMLLKAIDGKVIMDVVRPIAEKRLNQYRDRYPSANVIMDEEV